MKIVTLLRKPLSKGSTVAASSMADGTGGINVDGCRIETSEMSKRVHKPGVVYDGCHEGYERPGRSKYTHKTDWEMEAGGRWPANLILVNAAVDVLDAQSGDRPGMPIQRHRTGAAPKGYGGGWGADPNAKGFGDTGGASRFFKQVSI